MRTSVLVFLLASGCGTSDPVARISNVHEVAEDYADRVKRELEDEISNLEAEVQEAKREAEEAQEQAASLNSRLSACTCAE